MIFRLRTYALSIIAVLMFGDIAHAEQWQVVQTNGEIWITTETVQPVSLGSVSELPDGSTLITGEHGRVMLMRGERSMIIGPNSVVMVPPEIMGRTTVIQRIGEILFDIDKRSVKHFAVETPYLAAVVKGTNFTVLVEPTDAVVSVNKGRVEVKSILTGETVEIGRGQIAAVRGLGAKLTVTGSRAGSVEVWPGEARAPIVRPLPNNKLTALQGVWFELDAAKKGARSSTTETAAFSLPCSSGLPLVFCLVSGSVTSMADFVEDDQWSPTRVEPTKRFGCGGPRQCGLIFQH